MNEIAAEPVLTTLLDEIAATEKQSPSRAYLKNSLGLLLRKHDPATFKKIESKYQIVIDPTVEDEEALRKGADPKPIVERALERLARGQESLGILNIFLTIERSDPAAALRIVRALIDHAEKHPGSRSASMIEYIVDRSLERQKVNLSPEEMLRYYRALVAAARIELSAPKLSEYLSTPWTLRRSMQRILDLDKRLHAEAMSVVEAYRKGSQKRQLL